MAAHSGSTPKEVPASAFRRELGFRLAQLRERADIKQDQAARDAGIVPSSLSRVERGLRSTSSELVAKLLDAYDAGPTDRADLLALVSEDRSRTRPWWRKHNAVVGKTQYGALLALEAGARRLRGYDLAVIPGLLQTDAYAEHVIRTLRPELDRRQVQALVDVRVTRRRRLRESGIAHHAIIEESALTRPMGPPEIVRGQLESLLEGAPGCEFRMLPTAVGCHPGLYGSFLLVDFAEPYPSLAWDEDFTQSSYTEAPERVKSYESAFAQLWDLALPPAETCAHIATKIKELSP
ncbi:helix-turn-helix domain-containing protein [Embleya sp. MST-111070]|uniref:helix-turn-helix domain-containing protein n=1 Tax=Embleya sp. MST-111070 TaxID=3398231 RepID=UPI003F733970